MARAAAALETAALLGLLACSSPHFDLPDRAAPSFDLALEPAAAPDRWPTAFRARLRDAPSGTPWLLAGELSAAQTSSLRKGELSATLRERAVPMRFWHEGTDLVLQPLALLEPGGSYSLALAGADRLRVATAEETLPQVERVFPPPNSPKGRLEVVCGVIEPPREAADLLPGNGKLEIAPGVGDQDAPGCATLTASGDWSDQVVAPPVLGGSLLDPGPWLPKLASALAVRCTDGTSFHGGCLRALDDRVLLEAPSDWLVSSSALEGGRLAATAGRPVALARGAPSHGVFDLAGRVLTVTGENWPFALQLAATPARRHVLLNEVLANPLGSEPDAEWIELWNDADAPASLAELRLEDGGGSVRLPHVTLDAGELALLVVAGARPSSVDVAIPEQTRKIELPSLGARGLSNEGEALLLVGPEGIVSRFPRLKSAHAGRSIARRFADARDDDAGNFAEHGEPGASPGAPNHFD